VIPRAAGRALSLLPIVLLTFAPAQPVVAGGAAPIAASPRVAVPLSSEQAWNNFGLTKEVFGYASAGSLGSSSIGYPTWNFNLLATVAFFAIHLNYNGTLNTGDGNWSVWNSSTLTGLVNTAHAHGTKVVMTIVGPGSADLCNALYHGPTAVSAIVQQVVAKGVDGVNIDIESTLGQCNPTDPQFTPQTNQTLLTWFARDLRAGLDAAKPGYYLSIATYAGSALGNDGFFNIPDLNQYVDSFFVMAYDMDFSNQHHAPLNCSSFCMAPVSPLTNYYWTDTASMAQYSSVVGASKVILGQPYYARVSCVASVSAHATATTAVQAAAYTVAKAVAGSPDVKPGTYRIHLDPNDITGKDRWDAWYDNKLGCWRVMHWSDVGTLAARYDLVNRQNLRGVGFWTLNYGGGSPELWAAIQNNFVTCINTTVDPQPAPSQLSGTQVQLVAATTACANPRYEFWMQPPGGSWRIVQSYSSSPSYTWKTTGLKPGTYHFSVWARDAHSHGPNGTAPNTYDSFAGLDYPLTTQPCTAVGVSAEPASPVVGNSVVVTASATGCPNPSYEFWFRPPGGSWSIVQSYSTKATFSWSTGSRPPGSYLFSVWARDASSLGAHGTAPNTYDAASALPLSLGKAACPVVTATSTPDATADAGTSVAVTASVQGCPRPQYQVWLKAPGGAWTIVKPYSSSATFNWGTVGLAPGTYHFSVWARDLASGASYDSFAAFDYVLTSEPCTAMIASAAPPSPTTAGTPVTVTGAATGCPNVQYEFWMKGPSGGWALLHAYSSEADFAWTTAGLAPGTYTFSVWARDTSSRGTAGTYPTSYDSFGTVTYTLS
jgi:spore germination protein YaaH